MSKGDLIVPTHYERKAPTQAKDNGHEAVSEAPTASCDVLVDLLDMADDVFRDLEALGSACARLAGELVDEIEAELQRGINDEFIPASAYMDVDDQVDEWYARIEAELEAA